MLLRPVGVEEFEQMSVGRQGASTPMERGRMIGDEPALEEDSRQGALRRSLVGRKDGCSARGPSEVRARRKEPH